jgi:glucose/arabinose dehydrogenase
MKTTLALICLCGTISFTSCSQKSTTTSGSKTASVETKDPNADYKPAFEGQTRVRAIETKTPYRFDVLTEELDSPWGVKALPDGRLLITEKEGAFRIVNASGNVSEKNNKRNPGSKQQRSGRIIGYHHCS